VASPWGLAVMVKSNTHPIPRAPSQKLQQKQRGAVAPMQVVQDDYQRLGLRSIFQEVGDGVEEAESGRLRLQRRRVCKIGQLFP